jgi:hypothetical protein
MIRKWMNVALFFADIGVFIPQMKEGMEDNVYGNKPAPSKVPPTYNH